jgi:hypothetical protein
MEPMFWFEEGGEYIVGPMVWLSQGEELEGFGDRFDVWCWSRRPKLREVAS